MKDEIETNLYSIKQGWIVWALDMQKNWNQLKAERRVVHFVHACVTTTIAKPYRTWGLLFYPVVLLHLI